MRHQLHQIFLRHGTGQQTKHVKHSFFEFVVTPIEYVGPFSLRYLKFGSNAYKIVEVALVQCLMMSCTVTTAVGFVTAAMLSLSLVVGFVTATVVAVPTYGGRFRHRDDRCRYHGGRFH